MSEAGFRCITTEILFKAIGQPKLGGTTDSTSVPFLGWTFFVFVPTTHPPRKRNHQKGEAMNTKPQPVEEPEVNLQERSTQALTDDSLPAEQVITEQKFEAEENHTPRFIP